MPKKILVRKHSGEQQPFSEEKLLVSIMRAGAPAEIAQQVVAEIHPLLFEGISTHEIYRNAFQILRRTMRSLAARYSLKTAIMELGPSGYPFEKFVGEIFKKQGFDVKTGQVLQGRCVQHEMDVVAERNNLAVMVECKYRNDQGKISGVQVPLYVNSRMQDIRLVWQTKPENKDKSFQGWIVTNTRFSSDAEDYGICAGLHMVSWGFPERDNLRLVVEEYALYPVTALTTLSGKQKQFLLEKGIILVEQLLHHPGIMAHFGLTGKDQQDILSEAAVLSAVGQVL
jgi:Holliday junction resolvase-like predicted endonuclease